jgi:homoserine dehydrogenase
MEQVESARKAGYVVKLLAICERLTDAETGVDGVSARVYPALIPVTHPLAAVHGVNNAVFIEAEAAGNLMFYGAGAGGIETASAVLGDLVSAARRHVIGGPGVAESNHANLPVLPIAHVITRYQISLRVIDQPGVLAAIATLFSEHNVSVETLTQSAGVEDESLTGTDGSRATATLVIGTHEATEAALAATVTALKTNEVVRSVVSVLRVEGL